MIVQLTNEAVKCGLGGISIATVFSQLITSPRSSNASFSLVSASETTLQAAAGVARVAYRVKSSAYDGSEALSFFAILQTSDKFKLKSSGPRTLPCGTPLEQLNVRGGPAAYCTVVHLWWNHFSTVPPRPWLCKVCSSRSCRTHSKALGPGHTAARFGFLYAKRCSFHGYCSKILKLQREARRSEKRPEGQLLALLALQQQKKAQAAALAM